jgi:hypothetical protein
MRENFRGAIINLTGLTGQTCGGAFHMTIHGEGGYMNLPHMIAQVKEGR